MNHWPFIAAAYATTIAGICALLILSWRAMRRAEADAGALRQ